MWRAWSSRFDHGRDAVTDAHALEQEVIGYHELLTRHLEAPKPIVKGIIDEGCAAILAGPPNVGKTWLVLSLARAIASGSPWLGQFPTSPCPVVIFDEEGHLPGVQSRCRLLEAADPLDHAPAMFLCVGHGVRLDTQAGVDHLTRVIEQCQPGLVILDSLTRVHGADENDAGSMASVFAVAKHLMRVHHTAVLFTDHLRKKSVINDPEEMLRGSTEKRAWPDSILFAAPGDGTQIRITHVKSRWSQRLDPFAIDLAVDEDAGTASIRYAGEVRSDAITRGNDILEAIHAIRGQLGPDGADATAIAAWLDCGPDTVRRHVRKLVSAGLVRTRRAMASDRGGKPKDVYEIAGCSD